MIWSKNLCGRQTSNLRELTKIKDGGLTLIGDPNIIGGGITLNVGD